MYLRALLMSRLDEFYIIMGERSKSYVGVELEGIRNTGVHSCYELHHKLPLPAYLPRMRSCVSFTADCQSLGACPDGLKGVGFSS